MCLIAVHEAWIHMSKYTKHPLKITRTHRVIGININDYFRSLSLFPSCFSKIFFGQSLWYCENIIRMCIKYQSSMDLIASLGDEKEWNLHQWWFRWEISRGVYLKSEVTIKIPIQSTWTSFSIQQNISSWNWVGEVLAKRHRHSNLIHRANVFLSSSNENQETFSLHQQRVVESNEMERKVKKSILFIKF